VRGWEDREPMRKQHPRKKHRAAPKIVLRLPDLDQAKSAVLNSLTSADAQRRYRHAYMRAVLILLAISRVLFVADADGLVGLWRLGA
jgi:hypothetical protein